MRVQRFDTFLAQYAKTMHPENTLSFVKAEREAKGNHRFLTLFALMLLFDEKRAKTMKLHSEIYPSLYYAYVEESTKYPNLTLQTLPELMSALPPFDELKKAYQSYLRLVVESKRRDKELLLIQIKTIMRERRISKYRVYTDLKLNPGNINDFLKNDHVEKVGESTIRRILGYCQSA